MYIIKNALKSITRAKGRNILIFILVLCIASSACVALSIKNSAKKAEDAAYEKLNVTAQITLDRQKMMKSKDFDKTKMRELMSKSLSLEELETYAKSKTVDSFYYTKNVGMNVNDDFQVYESENSFNRKDFEGQESTDQSKENNNEDSKQGKGMQQNQQPGNDMGGTMQKMMGKSITDVTLEGYSSHDALSEFVSGDSIITDGNIFEQDECDNTCVISNEIVILNDLKIGDTITLINPNNEEEYKLTICGIFKNESSDANANKILVSMPTLEGIVNLSKENEVITKNEDGTESSTVLSPIISGTYVFKDVDNYEAFKEDAKDLGLDTETFTISSSDVESYKESTKPLENLSSFTGVFFIAILVVGGIILILFSIFTIRERKYEIGVLTAIGMKKVKVALQFLTETFVITILAIVIGSGIGMVASQPVGDYLLKNQISSEKEQAEKTENNFGGNFQGKSFNMNKSISSQKNNVSYIDSIVTSADASVLLSLMGVGLLLTLLASSVGMISILKYDPLKILSERS